MAKNMTSKIFTVHVREPELVRPEKPTPCEFKYLSNIDDQLGLQNHVPFAHIYRVPKGASSMDPARLIQRALSRALVQYYPLAGRLRHAENGKLVVECNGEGVLFREANADASIEQLQHRSNGFAPPFPHWNRLLVDDVYGSFSVTNSPLFRMQVTRFACGGFVLAYTFNHCACSTPGALQFITAVAELTRKPYLLHPSVAPVWSRESLTPRNLPQISFPHSEYQIPDSNKIYHPSDFYTHKQFSLFLSRATISAIKTLARASTSYDAVAALLWRSRARAIGLPKTSTAHLLIPVDTQHLQDVLPLPNGYYGNAVVMPCVSVPQDELCQQPLSYAASKIAMTKHLASKPEYRLSVIDYLDEYQGKVRVRGGKEVLMVSDYSKLRFTDVNFGWGRAVYDGPGRAGIGFEPGMMVAVASHRSHNNEVGLLLIFMTTNELADALRNEVLENVLEATKGKKGVKITDISSRNAVRSAL